MTVTLEVDAHIRGRRRTASFHGWQQRRQQELRRGFFAHLATAKLARPCLLHELPDPLIQVLIFCILVFSFLLVLLLLLGVTCRRRFFPRPGRSRDVKPELWRHQVGDSSSRALMPALMGVQAVLAREFFRAAGPRAAIALYAGIVGTVLSFLLPTVPPNVRVKCGSVRESPVASCPAARESAVVPSRFRPALLQQCCFRSLTLGCRCSGLRGNNGFAIRVATLKLLAHTRRSSHLVALGTLDLLPLLKLHLGVPPLFGCGRVAGDIAVWNELQRTNESFSKSSSFKVQQENENRNSGGT